MTTEPLPFIEEDDYEAIQKIAPDLPNTYADWLKAHERAKRERNNTNPVQVVLVRPHEFEAYCRDRGVQPSASALLRFAHDNAGPHEADHEYEPNDMD